MKELERRQLLRAMGSRDLHGDLTVAARNASAGFFLEIGAEVRDYLDRRWGRLRADHEDILQTVVLRLINNVAPRYKDKNTAAVVRRVTTNVALETWGKLEPTEHLESEKAPPHPPPPPPTPDPRLTELLDAAAELLREVQGMGLAWDELGRPRQDLTQDECAAIGYGQPGGALSDSECAALRKRYERALGQLRKILARPGFEEINEFLVAGPESPTGAEPDG